MRPRWLYYLPLTATSLCWVTFRSMYCSPTLSPNRQSDLITSVNLNLCVLRNLSTDSHWRLREYKSLVGDETRPWWECRTDWRLSVSRSPGPFRQQTESDDLSTPCCRVGDLNFLTPANEGRVQPITNWEKLGVHLYHGNRERESNTRHILLSRLLHLTIFQCKSVL